MSCAGAKADRDKGSAADGAAAHVPDHIPGEVYVIDHDKSQLCLLPVRACVLRMTPARVRRKDRRLQ